jgi:UDP-glucose 4-epimerase
MVEAILKDAAKAGGIDYIALRYFNVAGAHPSGEIGIKMDKPTHLIPNVMMAVSGKIKELKIFGTNYPTRDGSCIRDYVHVMDLCEAHGLALTALEKGHAKNEFINLGNGRGFTVKEVVAAAEKVTGRTVPVKIVPRRPGDCAAVVASYAKAKKLLGWVPKRPLADILRSAWDWENRKV